jgi:plasmid replication initiation protein
LRGSHQSTDRLQDVMDELLRTLLRVRVKSEDGGPDDVLTGAIVSDCKMAVSEDARAMVRWRFSEAMREVLRRSDHYAELRTQIVAALESRYSVTLYEIGCMLYRRQHQIWTVSKAEFRERLGVPASYRDWTDIERRTLQPAKAELDHLAPFTMDWRVARRRGRAIEALAISFTPKDGASRQAAEAELRRSRVGRKARRGGTVETVVAVPHLPGLEDEP